MANEFHWSPHNDLNEDEAEIAIYWLRWALNVGLLSRERSDQYLESAVRYARLAWRAALITTADKETR